MTMVDLMNEGIWPAPDNPGGGYPLGPTQQGAGIKGWGGTADAWGQQANMSSGFVIPGVATNHDPESGGAAQTNSTAAHYYQGYWAGVQAAMYAPSPFPSAPASYPIPGYGPPEVFPFLRPVSEIRDSSSERIGARNPFSDIIEQPEWGHPEWFDGLFGDHPAHLPDQGETPMPGFSPIKGKSYDIFSFVIPDVPTEQEIQDAGDPALWLSPLEVGPMDLSISSPGSMFDNMTPPPIFPPAPTTSTLIPFDITPGNNFPGDVTPRGDWTD